MSSHIKGRKPFLAYEIPSLFTRECEVGLETFGCSEGNLQARKDLLLNQITGRGSLLSIYTEIIKESVPESNFDGVYDPDKGYGKAFKEEICYVFHWLVRTQFERSISVLNSVHPTASRFDMPRDIGFLFPQEDPGLGIPLITGGPSVFSIPMGQSSEGYQEQVLDRLDTLIDILEKSDEEEEEEETPKKRTAIKTIVKKSPEEIARFLLDKAEISNRKEFFNTLWFSPPPIMPTDLYDFSCLEPGEAGLVLDLFFDLYQSQTNFLAFHFLARRLFSLWRRVYGQVESALYNSELDLILGVLRKLSERIGDFFSPAFLAFEGIMTAGSTLLGDLDKLFQERKKKETILSIDTFLERILDMIRSCCLVLDRLRLSLLYGPNHSSYVGDDLISSFFYLGYQTRHAESGFDTLLALIEPFGSITLPGDDQKVEDFFEKAQSKLPIRASLLGIQEFTGERRSPGEDGVIESIIVRRSSDEDLIDLQKKLWENII